MYSQNDEEKYVLAHYEGRPLGRFLDIGAYDGVTFSNVRALYDQGWGGVLVEPNPRAFVRLMDNYPDSARATLINVAIAAESVLRTFHVTPDAVSTLSEAHRELWSRQAQFVPIVLKTVTVPDLLQRYPGPYQFVNVDVEGTNWEVVQRLPLDAMQTDLVCVEMGEHGREMHAWFTAKGWRLVYQSGENQLWAR